MTVDDELSALMDRFFLAVSFGAGGTPEYERLPDLFTPAGRLINAIGDAPDDTTVTEFIEPRRALVGAAFAARGRIATQFVRTPGGWRITSMAWDDEA
jgi:hypothetical protein